MPTKQNKTIRQGKIKKHWISKIRSLVKKLTPLILIIIMMKIIDWNFLKKNK